MYYFHNWVKSCSQSKIRSQEHCLKLEVWQGPPHVNKVKQYETLLSFKVSLFIQFIQSRKQREFVYFVCLGIKKRLKKKTSSPKLHSAPLSKGSECQPQTLTWAHALLMKQNTHVVDLMLWSRSWSSPKLQSGFLWWTSVARRSNLQHPHT